MRRLEAYGVRIEEYDFYEWLHHEKDVERLTELTEKNYDFALIIGDSDQLHHGMKHMELNTRLVTQNICPKTIKKANNSLFDNLALKFNLNAGGLNWNIASNPDHVAQCRNRDLL